MFFNCLFLNDIYLHNPFIGTATPAEMPTN